MEMILPAKVTELHNSISNNDRHPGLQLDKYSKGGKQEDQRSVIDDVTECRKDNNLLSKLLKKRADWLDTLHTKRFTGKTEGPMTIHLSGSGALENAGIAMHPIYGFVWIPGSGIKGMCRAYAESVWLKEKIEQGEKDKALTQFYKAFGYTAEEIKEAGIASSNPEESASGRLVFHDAWPLTWPKLERDIVNNHHQKYYDEVNTSDKSKLTTLGMPPGDWEDPIPVNFLAIASGTEFDFAISDRKPQVGDELLQIATEWLQKALYNFGAGAKKAAGYGRIIPEGNVSEFIPKNLLRREYNLELASPAFLAGAKQKFHDCELRGATLRGQLRWWWRTMHAGSVNVNDLAKLEELVWGSAGSWSPISISVIPNSSNNAPFEFNKNEIKNRNTLPKSKGQRRTIQGLYYVSYGMDEVNKLQDNEEERRHCMSEGSKWKLVVIVMDGNKNLFGKDVKADSLIEQFEASLWLLTHYGGVGSKSRKGFGSFQGVYQESTSSIDDCLRVGQRLRDICEIKMKGKTDSPSLESRIGPVAKKTKIGNIWHTLNLIGDVYQDFIKALDKEDRKALGTPRDPKTKKKGKFDYLERHASPVHWSLIKEEDNTYTVQMLAFPSSKLPSIEKSEGILQKLEKYADEEFDNRKDSIRNQSGRGGAFRMRPANSRMPINPKAGLPKSGEIVQAVLLEERTKRGKWKAKLPDDSMIGSIENSDDVPSDKQPNDVVELLVVAAHPSNANFKWPVSSS